MRISHFFIDRPIFAAVVSIVFLIIGGVSYSRLPVTQYPEIAQVQVQNRVAIAQPRLPGEVRNIGVTVTKKSPDLMMVVHLYSPDDSRDTLFISNYATLSITDILTRIDGVGSITVFGSRDY